MTAVAWKASWKKDDSQWDGLGAHLDELVKDPHSTRFAYVRLEVVEVKDLVQEGRHQPKVAVKHVELVTDQAEILRVGGRMQAIYGQRTGRDDAPQPSLFDDAEAERDADADEGEEIMAERAEAKADAEAEALRSHEPWPGDVEFTAPADGPSGAEAAEAESSQVKRSARRPRK